MGDIRVLHNNEGDWAGLYVDGKLIHEGHSISDYEWARATGAEILYDDERKFGECLAVFGGRCPQTWAEVIEAANG